jgi:hypothetical protein
MSPGSLSHGFYSLSSLGGISVRTHPAVRRLTATLRQPSRLTGMARESPRRDGLMNSRLAVATLLGSRIQTPDVTRANAAQSVRWRTLLTIVGVLNKRRWRPMSSDVPLCSRRAVMWPSVQCPNRFGRK